MRKPHSKKIAAQITLTGRFLPRRHRCGELPKRMPKHVLIQRITAHIGDGRRSASQAPEKYAADELVGITEASGITTREGA